MANFMMADFNAAMMEKLCQLNPWLKRGGVDFEDDFCMEDDYQYEFITVSDIEALRAFFAHGNWAIRAGVVFGNLIFVNQVNGGDEWWTVKCFGDMFIPFESISFRHMLKRDEKIVAQYAPDPVPAAESEFTSYILRLVNATEEQCRKLSY